MASEYIYIAGDPNTNDYSEKTRMKGGELIKELKYVKPGNVG